VTPAPPERSAGLAAARVVAALALGALAVAVLRPFLTPIAWGAILAYVTWPLYRRLPGQERAPAVAAALFTAAVGVGLGVPVALILISLAGDTTDLARALLAWQEAGAPLPARLADHRFVQQALALVQESGFVDPARAGQWIGAAGARVSERAVALAGGIARNTLKFGVAMVSLYSFYLSGERLIEVGRRLAPLLFPVAPARFLESIGESVRAVMFGLLGTALVQGVLTGIGLAVAGVPRPVVFGTLAFVISVLPGGGGAVTLGAAAWLGLQGRLAPAIALALFGVLVVSSMDNLLRPLLISERGRIPFLLVFLGVLGGLSAFGLVGAFLGPVVLSVAFTLLVEFARSPHPVPDRADAAPPAGGTRSEEAGDG